MHSRFNATHTNNWDYYIKIPNLLQKMEKNKEASIVYLYLARYQIATGNFESAIDMLEHYHKIANDRDVSPMLVDLYYHAKDVKRASALSMKLISNDLKCNSAILYTHILRHDPSKWPLYRTLASLKTSPIEKAHILCKGTLEAILVRDYDRASAFIKEAERYYNVSFINKLIVVELHKQSDNTSNFEQELLHVAKREEPLHPKHALIFYKLLCASSNNIDYCVNMHNIYSRLGNYKKSVKWLLQGRPIVDGILDLSNKKSMLYIREEGAKELAKNLPTSLTSLYLSRNNIGAEGAKELAKNLPASLTSLDLSGNNIGTKGAKELAKNLPASLTSLDLESNKIGDEGAKELAKNLPASLTSLDLESNGIRDEGAKRASEKFTSESYIITFGIRHIQFE